jgi:hypothetical protein
VSTSGTRSTPTSTRDRSVTVTPCEDPSSGVQALTSATATDPNGYQPTPSPLRCSRSMSGDTQLGKLVVAGASEVIYGRCEFLEGGFSFLCRA